ncbi:RyR domain-containing protein [Streptomyces sp. NPDC001107]
MRESGGWTPRPVDTDAAELGPDLLALVELLAENAHDRWALRRIAEGWRYGQSRDDEKLTHPLLVPYADLPESEKEYDRELAVETLKVILALGHRILPPPRPA